MSQRMRARVDKTVFYTDMGWSTGMKEFCRAIIDGKSYEAFLE